MPLRNPFRRTIIGNPEDLIRQNESHRRLSDDDITESIPSDSTLAISRNTTSTSSTTILDVPDPIEHELYEISDTGIFLPPPTSSCTFAHNSNSSSSSKQSFWPTRSTSSASSSSSSASTAHRSIFSDAEPFSISRESFDSYRRSFDIGAKSPVVVVEAPGPGRAWWRSRGSVERDWPREEEEEEEVEEEELGEAGEGEGFEDVMLADDAANKPVKKKGLFAFVRFGGDDGEMGTTTQQQQDDDVKSGKPTGAFQLFGGRKRGQSIGLGNELASMPRPGILAGGQTG